MYLPFVDIDLIDNKWPCIYKWGMNEDVGAIEIEGYPIPILLNIGKFHCDLCK